MITDCGFNVVSVAGNHAMDWGPEPLLDTTELLRAKGIRVVGGGRNLAEARQPAIMECKGQRVAMLAYCSVLHEGAAAGPDTPGVAPMRTSARFEPVDYQPGVPPRVITTPDEEDLANLIVDLRQAKEQADAVVLSLHWGATSCRALSRIISARWRGRRSRPAPIWSSGIMRTCRKPSKCSAARPASTASATSS